MKEALDEAGAVRVNIDIIIYFPLDFRIEGSFDGTAFRIQNSRCCKFWLGIITRISIRLTKINFTNSKKTIDILLLAMEPRQITRWEAARFAREAYEVGVRVIGGCCGFESHHIRAMAEELAEERGRLPAGSQKSDYDLSVMKGKADTFPYSYGSK